MTNSNKDIQVLTKTLDQALRAANISMNASELHGMVSGMICCGLTPTEPEWQDLLQEYTSEGKSWSSSLKKQVNTLVQTLSTELNQSALSMTLWLDEEEDLFLQADTLSNWVIHFISGLGLANINLKNSGDDVQDAIKDLEEISRLGIDQDDDLVEQQALLEQVKQYVKICVYTIYQECGANALKVSNTIH